VFFRRKSRTPDPLLSSVQRLELEPGEVLVLKVGRKLDSATCHRIREELEGIFPTNKIAILDVDLDFSVVETRDRGKVRLGDETEPVT
jgi:hypothetical protein